MEGGRDRVIDGFVCVFCFKPEQTRMTATGTGVSTSEGTRWEECEAWRQT